MPHPHVIALHGGAGVNPARDYREVEAHLAALVRDCEARLAAGEAARFLHPATEAARAGRG